MAAPFSNELTELQANVSMPDSVRVFLTTFGPPVRDLAQVALIGEDTKLLDRVLRDANVESLPMQLSARFLPRSSSHVCGSFGVGSSAQESARGAC